MHKAVLVNAYVYERAEVDYVAHGAVNHHSHLQVLYAHYVLAQFGRGERIAYVPAGAQKFGDYIPERSYVEFGVFGRLLFTESFYLLRKFGKIARLYVLFGIAEEF